MAQPIAAVHIEWDDPLSETWATLIDPGTLANNGGVAAFAYLSVRNTSDVRVELSFDGGTTVHRYVDAGEPRRSWQIDWPPSGIVSYRAQATATSGWLSADALV